MAKAMEAAVSLVPPKGPSRRRELAISTSLVHIHSNLQQEETKVIKKAQK
ncbi:hypothetical protein [Variovorax paradoxus]|nr:hypothetical protein [Variovorax paradoxus]